MSYSLSLICFPPTEIEVTYFSNTDGAYFCFRHRTEREKKKYYTFYRLLFHFNWISETLTARCFRWHGESSQVSYLWKITFSINHQQRRFSTSSITDNHNFELFLRFSRTGTSSSGSTGTVLCHLWSEVSRRGQTGPTGRRQSHFRFRSGTWHRLMSLSSEQPEMERTVPCLMFYQVVLHHFLFVS